MSSIQKGGEKIAIFLQMQFGWILKKFWPITTLVLEERSVLLYEKEVVGLRRGGKGII